MPLQGWLNVCSPHSLLMGRFNTVAALFLGALFAGSALLPPRGRQYRADQEKTR
jgi:hypothetical protein